MEIADKKLYLVLISIHGLIRGNNLELGRDADTGGQTQYVVELARALSENDSVAQVDLVTRRVIDQNVSGDYARPIEKLSDRARIVRIDAGPEEYIAKEQLWDHLDSFLDNLTEWLKRQQRLPDVLHSHYPDAGFVAVRLANLLGIPLIHTGHSLGRDKRKRLLASGVSKERIEQTYNIARRIAAEEEALANADLVITSTHNEIEEQYSLYNYYDPERMVVIPPGTDLKRFHPPADGDSFAFRKSLEGFLREPSKPMVLALSRPDERKNLTTLLEAYGESLALQQAANLLLVAGMRTDIRELNTGARDVLTQLLLLMDCYDLYGKVAMPKNHRPEDVPEIYRMVAASGGVFINPALTEPFGLTLLEAAASGLPVVATENGGPVDIIANCRNGELVDPLDKEQIAEALLRLLNHRDYWQEASASGMEGVARHYTWSAHAEQYLKKIKGLQGEHRPLAIERALPLEVRYRKRAIFSDLDQSLLGDTEALKQYLQVLRQHRKQLAFGIATGRRLDSALAVMKKHGIPAPDVLISGLGTRIHYGKGLTEDDHWTNHIDHHWNPRKIQRILTDQPGMEPQPNSMQSHFKISYYYQPDKGPSIDELIALLHQHEITANVICSFGQYIDIVPARASKGQALRYVALRLDIPLEQILVAGGSGADEDMMRGNTLAVVVANRHEEELSQLVNLERIYFARQEHAFGIVEAIEHYQFLPQGTAAEV